MRTWFITGISRGLGLALAQEALAQGDRVVGTTRTGPIPHLGTPDRQRVLHLDLADTAAVARATHDAFAAWGRIDVIVNNAGSGLFGPFELTTHEEARHLFDVDVLAPMAAIRTALPYLRAQGSGNIITITSIAGRAPGIGAAVYASAKAALEGFSAALAQEVAPLGIRVTAIAPGQFRTGFIADNSVHTRIDPASPYYATVGENLSALAATYGRQRGDPARAARVICALAGSQNAPLHLLLGSDAYGRAERKLKDMAQEMRLWKSQTFGTDFPPSNTEG